MDRLSLESMNIAGLESDQEEVDVSGVRGRLAYEISSGWKLVWKSPTSKHSIPEFQQILKFALVVRVPQRNAMKFNNFLLWML